MGENRVQILCLFRQFFVILDLLKNNSVINNYAGYFDK